MIQDPSTQRPSPKPKLPPHSAHTPSPIAGTTQLPATLMQMDLLIREVDLAQPADARALVTLIDDFAQDPGGQGAPLSSYAKAHMAAGIANTPGMFALFAVLSGEPVGVAVCRWEYSTFTARPFVNLQDLAVAPRARSRGIGRKLLEDIEHRARAHGCAKFTLEVHDANQGAKRLYESFGFGPFDATTLHVEKKLNASEDTTPPRDTESRSHPA